MSDEHDQGQSSRSTNDNQVGEKNPTTSQHSPELLAAWERLDQAKTLEEYFAAEAQVSSIIAKELSERGVSIVRSTLGPPPKLNPDGSLAKVKKPATDNPEH